MDEKLTLPFYMDADGKLWRILHHPTPLTNVGEPIAPPYIVDKQGRVWPVTRDPFQVVVPISDSFDESEGGDWKLLFRSRPRGRPAL